MMKSYLTIPFFVICVNGFMRSMITTRNNRVSLRMGLFDRFVRVVSSNVNSVLKGLEDPEKVLDQAVNDMQNDLVKIRQSYAEISASQKRMQKQKEQADGLSSDWYKRAQLALVKGDEDLAREALSRRQIQVDIGAGLEKQINLQQNNIDKLYTSMMTLETKITEAKREKDAFIARARTAKTSVQVNDMLSSLSSTTSTNSMEAFNRMKEKVENLEAQAEIAGELAANNAGTSVNMEERFKALETNTALEDELEKLKRQLPSGQSDVRGMLPPSTMDIAVDDEYERMKRELRKK